MKGFRTALVALGLSLASVTTAIAAPAGIPADTLTISGRWALPKAAGTPLAGQLQIGEVVVDKKLADTLGVKPESLAATIREALGKSLVNFGYGAPGGGVANQQVKVNATLGNLTTDAEGTVGVATLSLSSSQAGSACFPFSSEGKYHALTRLQSGGGQKAAAVVAVIAFAAVGVNAGQMAAGQFESANRNNQALNDRRVVGQDEGVAPPGGEAAQTKYAVTNALQVSIRNLIAYLGQPGGCNAPAVVTPVSDPAPAAPTAPPAAPAATDAVPAASNEPAVAADPAKSPS